MAHGFIKGLLVGSAAAAVGYAGYKMLSEEKKQEVNRKVADATDKVVEYVMEVEAIAGATMDSAKEKAEESVKEAGLESKFDALKEQATDLMNQAVEKAQNFKNESELMEAVTESDIILDASDLASEVTAPEVATPEKVEVVVLEAHPLPEEELKTTAKEQVKSLAKSSKKPLSESKKTGLAEEAEADKDKHKSAAKSKSTKKSSSAPKKKVAKTSTDTLSKTDRPELSKSEKSLAETDKKGLAEKDETKKTTTKKSGSTKSTKKSSTKKTNK